MAKLIDEGPRGTLERAIHTGGYRTVPSGGDHSNPSSSTVLDSTQKRSASMPGLDAMQNARGRGSGTSPTAPPHLKPPMTGCCPSHHHRFHRMRPDRSQPQRDAGPGG